ncbi:MAG TPA: TonB-dependent receptor, partial [Edaphobacter sp.]|nr:TonB-dependent receptor [Edaphobacter sp.]
MHQSKLQSVLPSWLYSVVRFALVLGCVYLISDTAAKAQRITASIVGTTRDSSDATIPGSIVTVTNIGTHISTTVKTDGEGQFVFSNLPPGPYSITADATGFKHSVRSGIVLDVDQTTHLDIVLEIGSTSEMVEVNSAAPLLETQTSDVGQVISNASIENLPLNQRNPFSLVLLVPGVTGTVNSTFTGMQFNVNGGRAGSSDVLLDGVPSAPPTDDSNSLAIFPSVDATQEFKVQTSNFSSQFGNTGGGIINVVYKSGTNNMHGSVYDYFRNS